MKLPGVVSNCFKQFHCSNCSLNHAPANNFIKSQWQNRTHSKWYLIYRWILGLYFLTTVIISMCGNKPGYFFYYFIYLTNWGIMMCAITTVYGAILLSLWYCHPKYTDNAHNIEDMPTSFKIFWWLHNSTLVLSICITIIYWGILFDDTHELSAVNVMTHATNSILMFLDMMIVSHPYRLLHLIQPVLLGVAYAIFSVIYYFAGGEDVKGNKFIYFILDWSKPGGASVTILMTLALCVVIHSALLLVYYLRTMLYMRYLYKEDLLPTTQMSVTANQQSANNISMVFGHENRSFDLSGEDNNNNSDKKLND